MGPADLNHESFFSEWDTIKIRYQNWSSGSTPRTGRESISKLQFQTKLGVGQLLFIIRNSLTHDYYGGKYEMAEKAYETEFYYLGIQPNYGIVTLLK